MQRWLSVSQIAWLHGVVARGAQSLSARQTPLVSVDSVTSPAISVCGPCVGRADVSMAEPRQPLAAASSASKVAKRRKVTVRTT